VIRVYDAAGKLIETHEHKGDFKTFESAPQFRLSAHTASDETGFQLESNNSAKYVTFMLDLGLFSYYTRI